MLEFIPLLSRIDISLKKVVPAEVCLALDSTNVTEQSLDGNNLDFIGFNIADWSHCLAAYDCGWEHQTRVDRK